jgi:glutathione S-transferase
VLRTKDRPTTSAGPLPRKFHVSLGTLHNGLIPSRETETNEQKDAIERFRKETLRVYGVLEIRLSGKYTGEPREYLAGKGKGKYSVADIKTWPWVKGWEKTGFTQAELDEFPHLLKWIDRIAARPAVQKGISEKYSQ